MDDAELDELTDLELSGRSHEELARLFEERAQERPAGSEARSAYLNAAGDHWEYLEDHARAEASYRAAIADGGDPTRYAEGALVLLLLQAGRDEEADAVLADLLRAARASAIPAATYEIVANALEEAGRLREALRWYTMPLRDTDPDDLDRVDVPLLHARRRVRAALGLAEDRYDLEIPRLAGD